MTSEEQKLKSSEISPNERSTVNEENLKLWMNTLVSERDKVQADIIERKKRRITFIIDNTEKGEDYISRLGEISLAFVALVVPIIAITDSFDKIRRPELLFVGTGVYLLVGIFSMLKRKSRLESEATNLPGAGIDVDINAVQIHNALNKLISHPREKRYCDEYVQSKLNYLNRTEKKGEEKSRIDYSLDIAFGGFLLATSIIIGLLWPYSILFYVGIVLTILIGYLIYLVINTRSVMKLICESDEQNKRLAEVEAGYVEWFKNDRLGK